MGYTTDFSGEFEIIPPLSKEDNEFLTKLANTRRVKRKVGPEYGIEGEFYVDGDGFLGQNQADSTIINYNYPPKTQPSLWLQWIPTEDGDFLEWDGGEKFYNYIEWLEYLIEKIFIPRGYTLNGEVIWQGEDNSDIGKIIVENNEVVVLEGRIVYE